MENKTYICCVDCVYYTNSSIEHDDPFTSQPYPRIDYCAYEEKLMYLEDCNKINPQCPKNKK